MMQSSIENQSGSSFEYDEYEAMNSQQISHNQNQTVKTWNKQEKIVIISFGIISILVLVLGFLQFNSRRIITVEDLFGESANLTESQQKQLVSGATQPVLSGGNSQNTQNLSLLDTDKDGLSDADELNIYGTSPYLDDSDSDGVSDKDEIESGENPNCPKGKNCGYVATGLSDGDSQDTNFNAGSGSQAQLLDFGLPDGSAAGDLGLDNLSGLEKSLLTGSLDGKGMRELLQQQGAPQDLLNQVSDEDLEVLYNTSLGKIKEEGLLNSDGSLNPSEAFTNLSVAQIRELMVQAGMDEATVNQLSDDEVSQIYQQTLSNLN